MDLAGGQLTIRSSGIRWRAGSWLTPYGRASGGFELPWSNVKSADILDLDGKMNSLGGDLTIEVVSPHVRLTGEFLGSRSALREAIDAVNGARGT